MPVLLGCAAWPLVTKAPGLDDNRAAPLRPDSYQRSKLSAEEITSPKVTIAVRTGYKKAPIRTTRNGA